MASVISMICPCGQHVGVYVPKALMMDWLGMTESYPGQWAELDAEEEANGEIEFAKYVSGHLSGSKFLDYRTNGDICPGCGKSLQIEATHRRLTQQPKTSLN